MKRISLVLFLICISAAGIRAADVMLGWEPVTFNTDGTVADDLNGYRIYKATFSFISPAIISVEEAKRRLSVEAATVPAVSEDKLTRLSPSTTYYFRLTAVDVSGNESEFNVDENGDPVEIVVNTPPAPRVTSTPLVPQEVNASQDSVRIRVEATCEEAAAIEAVTANVVKGRRSYTFHLVKAQGEDDVYEAVVPSTMTMLLVGNLKYTITVRDIYGNVYEGEEESFCMENCVEGALSGEGAIELPVANVSGGRSAADFANLPPSRRPQSVGIHQLDENLFTAGAGETIIDTSKNDGLPVVVYRFSADNNEAANVFCSPVKLTLSYADIPAGVEAQKLRVFHLDLSGRWRCLGGTVNTEMRTVSVETKHFSTFALFAANPGAGMFGASSVKTSQRFITPLRSDGYNDTVTFGLEARQVDIYDMNGGSVFASTGDGTSAIQWTARNAAGNVVESGSYIARVRDAAGTSYYQAIIVAK
ncbi:MAG: hypothetical protein A2219_05755 [Elusimicrobia bacterium RIFOXYA2_FULL_50_26]|nr:MAG: hypothetical protein A2219_05755 [Elusimicrobia bacterium RIFOXYA2_FULL_50_26]OGS23569.1 MAG: hypothetical protein A2314_03175 [Elusimicrobia bacterium RIFOXYB2_FULL_50_12]